VAAPLGLPARIGQYVLPEWLSLKRPSSMNATTVSTMSTPKQIHAPIVGLRAV
jgi:hypothetical protein